MGSSSLARPGSLTPLRYAWSLARSASSGQTLSVAEGMTDRASIFCESVQGNRSGFGDNIDALGRVFANLKKYVFPLIDTDGQNRYRWAHGYCPLFHLTLCLTLLGAKENDLVVGGG